MSLNSWAFTGNLGGDAETRFTQSGDAIVSFSVGVKSGYGEKASTTWARCSMFGKRGQAVADYLVKGQLVGIVGELTIREYQTKAGETKTSTDVRVNDLTLLGKRDGEPKQQKQAPATSGELEDDIPF